MKYPYYEICRIYGQQMSLIAKIKDIFVTLMIFSALYSSSKYDKSHIIWIIMWFFGNKIWKSASFQICLVAPSLDHMNFFHIMAMSNMISSSLSWWYGNFLPIMRKFYLEYEKFALNMKNSALYFEENLFSYFEPYFQIWVEYLERWKKF